MLQPSGSHKENVQCLPTWHWDGHIELLLQCCDEPVEVCDLLIQGATQGLPH
jgi:hypothetical protein